ncbi:MAG: PqqD family peptide modification chaperone [Acidimicrobiales bacterium]
MAADDETSARADEGVAGHQGANGNGVDPPDAGEADQIEADDIDMGFVPAARADVAGVEMDGETVLLDEVTGATHLLNPVATVIWKCFDGTGSIDELVTDLADAFGAPREMVAEDVLALAREVGANGLLEGVAMARPQFAAPPRPASVPEGTPVPAFDCAGAGDRVRLSDHRGKEVLLVHWSPTCGFCDRIVPDLVEAEPLLAERAVAVVLTSIGTPEAHDKYREQGLGVPIALPSDDDAFDLFAGVGTPAAYLLDEHGAVASALSIGAIEVADLVRRLAGLPDLHDGHDHEHHNGDGHAHDHH